MARRSRLEGGDLLTWALIFGVGGVALWQAADELRERAQAAKGTPTPATPTTPTPAAPTATVPTITGPASAIPAQTVPVFGTHTAATPTPTPIRVTPLFDPAWIKARLGAGLRG